MRFLSDWRMPPVIIAAVCGVHRPHRNTKGNCRSLVAFFPSDEQRNVERKHFSSTKQQRPHDFMNTLSGIITHIRGLGDTALTSDAVGVELPS